jgi:four helix bundle protein
MGAKSFKDLIAWQLARDLRRAVRPLLRKAEANHDFDLKEQLLSAARSVTSNIAEGFPCSHIEYARFLEMSSRSLEEIEDRIIEMVDDHLITQAEARPILFLKMRTSRAIAGLRAHLLSTPDPPTYKPLKRTRRGT